MTFQSNFCLHIISAIINKKVEKTLGMSTSEANPKYYLGDSYSYFAIVLAK